MYYYDTTDLIPASFIVRFDYFRLDPKESYHEWDERIGAPENTGPIRLFALVDDGQTRFWHAVNELYHSIDSAVDGLAESYSEEQNPTQAAIHDLINHTTELRLSYDELIANGYLPEECKGAEKQTKEYLKMKTITDAHYHILSWCMAVLLDNLDLTKDELKSLDRTLFIDELAGCFESPGYQAEFGYIRDNDYEDLLAYPADVYSIIIDKQELSNG